MKSPRKANRSRRGARQERKKTAVKPPTAERESELEAVPAEEAHPAGDGGFPIVGIGASAGGLEALEAFLKNVPDRSGMAFVVIQHLDPTHKGAMVELLQRTTRMPVIQVEDNLKVVPDRVYVIPPNKDMSIYRGTLHLLPQAAPRGLNLPIDCFFRSLASDQQERSIGVILSGMGSDGTLGLRAIKEKAGAGFVQSLSSAKFDGMPSSAMEAGLADVVAPVEELPAKILAYREHAPYISQPYVPSLEQAQSALDKVLILLRMHTGNDFSLYKKSTVYRRVERRMGLRQIDKIANYVRYLRETPREIQLLFEELLIGVTSFFRDPGAWDHLSREVMPALIAEHSPGSVLRAWVPGCSTGEEAYSLAIVFKEAMERQKTPKNLSLQVFATDLDQEGIDKARQGLYPSNIAADVSPERLRRFFLQEERGYRMSKDIREMVIFAPQNVIMDPPFTKLDILSCRNLLIYLAPETQKRLVPLFHYSLNPGGILLLGSAETIAPFSTLFGPLDGKTRLYRRLETGIPTPPVEFPISFSLGKMALQEAPNLATPPPNFQALTEHLLLQHYAPAAILVNDRGDIAYISGRTGKYLEPAVGRANWNIFAMARQGLRLDLSTAFSKAMRDGRQVTVKGVKVQTNGDTQTVNVMVHKLEEPKVLRGLVLIVIADAPPAEEPRTRPRPITHRRDARLSDLEYELQLAREDVQTTREEMQTSQEELKSTNEELQSTNEELQSTNEELTTSKEEMQSLNEELQTVNHELQNKVDELSRSNSDMKNLLNSTDIATLFLDGELRVRRYTTQTARIIKLIPGDMGRPITDLVTELDYPDLADDAREVLRTLMFRETIAPTRNGHWFTVRIMPYRTLENVIDGVVVTFTDATAAKALERAVQEQADQLKAVGAALPVMLFSARPDGTCDHLNKMWIEYTGIPEPEQLGNGWLAQVHPADRDRVRTQWRDAVTSRTPLRAELRIRGKDSTWRWFEMFAAPAWNRPGEVLKWYVVLLDLEDKKHLNEERQRSSERLATILDDLGDGFCTLSDKAEVTCFNHNAERLLGRKREEVKGMDFFEAFPRMRGSSFEEKCRQALREKVPAAIEARLDGAPHPDSSSVWISPHGEDIWIFLKDRAEAGSAGSKPEVA
ncbi:MAG TPA: chemotaxis protein CheB [Anaeromyxobacteraceae bacterium]|nr:chemotaxis protein CheB [Anaeromyxobacteraceae bacterium]